MTDEISDEELERRMRKSLFNSTKVEARKKGDRAKSRIDPSGFKRGGQMSAPSPAREVPEYVVHIYSPEYDEPFWRIYQVGRGGELKPYLNCRSDAELKDCIAKLEASGAKVRRMGHE